MPWHLAAWMPGMRWLHGALPPSCPLPNISSRMRPAHLFANHPPHHKPTPAGNNAVEMETTATFDQAADEWIIHTPSSLGQK
jgi:hypothetical protein